MQERTEQHSFAGLNETVTAHSAEGACESLARALLPLARELVALFVPDMEPEVTPIEHKVEDEGWPKIQTWTTGAAAGEVTVRAQTQSVFYNPMDGKGWSVSVSVRVGPSDPRRLSLNASYYESHARPLRLTCVLDDNDHRAVLELVTRAFS